MNENKISWQVKNCRNYHRWNEYLYQHVNLYYVYVFFSIPFFTNFLCILYCLWREKYRSKFDTAKTSHECTERYWYTYTYNIPSIAINNVRMMKLIDIIIHNYTIFSLIFFSFPIKINTVTSGDLYNIIHYCGKRWMRFMYNFSVALIHRNLPSACGARLQVFFYIFCSALLCFFYKSLTRDIRAMGWAHYDAYAGCVEKIPESVNNFGWIIIMMVQWKPFGHV